MKKREEEKEEKREERRDHELWQIDFVLAMERAFPRRSLKKCFVFVGFASFTFRHVATPLISCVHNTIQTMHKTYTKQYTKHTQQATKRKQQSSDLHEVRFCGFLE